MRIRTFIARDMREAMAQIRAEMGVEAVIISSQRAKGGGILVRAAVEETPAEAQHEEAVAAHAERLEADAALPGFEQQYHQGLIRRLRTAPPKTEPAAPSRNFNRAELLTILRGHRAPDALAPALAEAAEKTGLTDMTLALASALDGRMKTRPIELAKASALLLTGPHGAGKTAVAAKLAAQARLAGRVVKLIAGDAKGAGAVERLKTFAEHLSIGCAVAEDTGELAQLVGDCAKTNTLAIIDTAGFDPRNGKARSAFAALAKIGGIEAIGVVSATSDAEEMREIAAALTSLGARRQIVTGLDTARRLGTLAAVATTAPALAHVTRSPFLGGALETLTPLSLARALIGRDTTNSTHSTCESAS